MQLKVQLLGKRAAHGCGKGSFQRRPYKRQLKSTQKMKGKSFFKKEVFLEYKMIKHPAENEHDDFQNSHSE